MMMASKAERKEEWENRQNKGRHNETWVKVKENTKAILKGEELWKSTKPGTHYDLTRGDGDDQYKIECKSNNGNLSKPQRKDRDDDPSHYKLVRTQDGTNPIHEADKLVRKIKKKI
jgi:hypothetical protein